MLIFLPRNEHIARNVQPQHKCKHILLSILTNMTHPSSRPFPLNLPFITFSVHTSFILSIYCPLILHVSSMSLFRCLGRYKKNPTTSPSSRSIPNPRKLNLVEWPCVALKNKIIYENTYHNIIIWSLYITCLWLCFSKHAFQFPPSPKYVLTCAPSTTQIRLIPPSMKFALHHCVAHVIFKNKEASGVISISHLHLALGKKAQLASLTRFDSI